MFGESHIPRPSEGDLMISKTALTFIFKEGYIYGKSLLAKKTKG